MSVTLTQAVLASLIMLVGASVGGAVGFGTNLVAAPLLILVSPDLVPVPNILASLVVNVLVIRREAGAHHWRAMRWPIVGLVPGSVAGAAVVAFVTKDALTVFFGFVILVAVGLSASGLHPRRTPRTLTTAGIASGFMGTAVGIGGPPIALLYQKATGPEIRGELSRFFAVGSIVSIALLGAFGQVHPNDVALAGVMAPGAVAGYLVSGWLATRVERHHVRIAVLVLSFVSAVVAIARVVL